MNSWKRVMLPLLIVLPLAAAGETVLDCNFNDKTLDAAIGTGGAAVGEPVDTYSVTAIVRDAPFATQCLEMTDGSETGTWYVRFEFLNDLAYSSGVLTLSAMLHMQDEGQGYVVNLREQPGSAYKYCTLRFGSNGTIYYSDGDTANGQLGPWTTGDHTLTFTYNLDEGHYTVRLDDSDLLVDETYGTFPAGLGSIAFGLDVDAGLEGTWFLDNLVADYDAVAVTRLPLSEVKLSY